MKSSHANKIGSSQRGQPGSYHPRSFRLVPVQTNAVKVATDAIAPAKVKFDTATAELNAIKAIVEKLKATTVVTK